MAPERLGNKETPKSESLWEGEIDLLKNWECDERWKGSEERGEEEGVEKMREWDGQDVAGIDYHFIFLE